VAKPTKKIYPWGWIAMEMEFPLLSILYDCPKNISLVVFIFSLLGFYPQGILFWL
jgi:hypothetical protein